MTRLPDRYTAHLRQFPQLMVTGQRLSANAFAHEDVVQHSRDLLGKVIVTHIDGQRTESLIVETEAYRAPDDRACHAHLNRYTQRTKTMFEPGGTAYIYLCYGIHHLFNIITGPAGMAHAVLIRAVAPIAGWEVMQSRRARPRVDFQLTAGPGKLSQAIGLTRALNGVALDTHPDVWIEDRSVTFDEIAAGPRIGIDYAGDYWKAVPWRFWWAGCPWVSVKR